MSDKDEPMAPIGIVVVPAKLPDHVKQAVQAKMPLTLDQLWTAILEELDE